MNKSILTTATIAALLLTSCNSTKKTTNDLAVQTPIVTTLDLTKVDNDKVPVTVNPGRFTIEKVTYRLPRVVQGTYSVSDFGKYVDSFKALDYEGNELEVTKVDTNTWAITNAEKLDKVTYLVNDTFDMEVSGGIGGETPFSPAGTNIESTNYVLNLHGFVGYFDSLKNNQYKLDVVSPTNFKRTSALQEVGTKTSEDGSTLTSSYFAPRYFDITDNPMFYGELDVEEFKVGDIKIVLSVYSPNKKHSAEKLKKVMEKMMQAQKAYLGSINSTARYDIYLYLSDGTEKAPKGFGALEHHTSTVVVLPEAMPDEALAKSMIDVVSHEFFHIVTPLSVHSEDVHYFDYNQPTFSKHLWMYEGITEYFATLFQINQGLVTEDEFYSKIMGKIKTASTMNDAMSFTKMSENVLEEPYASQYYNVYQKGALIGMCIDILMREESNGNRGVLSLMKELSLKYGKNKPFEDDKLIGEITEMTYPSIGAFLNTHVVGGTPINYNEFFAKAGLVLDESKVKTNYIQNDGAMIVRPDKATQTIRFTEAVKDNSFWAENGAQPNDAIKEVDGVAVTKESANQIFTKMFMWQPGNEVEVKLERDGKEVVIKTTLTQSYTKGTSLKDDPNATQKQKELRKAWLKG
ncbi:Predicted metalloprotease, contains C-terminal PDZ domain [Tenacibaculum mesophilum]|uniref:Peptidase M61 n=1 Tax=Tenacibaculum mesophilum TaxID=104268 RepID=A0ABN5T7Y9_9FLAO|nr:peptidase M61 [Tenacibaculum mesophilum]AZJ33338.1 peptidase M61 [Tenacibaculum mesophilum]QFS28581.1 peptidase M61 [Tenacibaculum mesophilum]SHF63019.1 Predicted metalloprotease, contains C-terminal PDZ domain [Tenacibaculum mesophilum]